MPDRRSADCGTPSHAAAGIAEEFVAALQAVATPVLALSRDGIILCANAAGERLLSTAGSSLVGVDLYSFVLKELQTEFNHYLADCFDKPLKAQAAHELQIQTASGSLRYVEVTAQLVQRPGVPSFGVLSIQDFSDIRHVQSSLLDVGRVLHQIVESIPIATFVVDKDHRVIHWNAACAQLTGVEATEVLGRTDAWRAFYPEARPLLADMIVDGNVEEVGQTRFGAKLKKFPLLKDSFEVEAFFPRFDVNGKWLLFNAAPLVDAHGQLIGAIETLQDVTVRHQAELELERHRVELEQLVVERTAEMFGLHTELEAFLSNASVGIISTANQKITRANKKFCEMFDVEMGQAIGAPSRDFFPSAEAYQELGKAAIPVLSVGQPFTYEAEMLSRSGKSLWIQLIAYVANNAEPTKSTWWILQDCTDVKRVQRELLKNYERIQYTNKRLEDAQNQLVQSEKMAAIGQLAAGVAHEINNPIGFISFNISTWKRYTYALLFVARSYANFSQEELNQNLRDRISQELKDLDLGYLEEDLPQLISESEEGLTRVKNIVNDLKNFSRVDQADWQLSDINAGLDSTLNMVLNEVKYKATVLKEFAALPPVLCLAGQINQVLMNLIVNASHAIPKFGEIRLNTRQQDEWVVISVSDNGCGMSEETIRRIFEPFYTTKPVGQGTGLGLSLSFSIVQKHGGRIEVKSALGQGSTFSVWLPIGGPDGRKSVAGESLTEEKMGMRPVAPS